MRSFITTFSVTAVLAAGLGTPASSAPQRGNEDLKTYCSGDAMTFCGDKDPSSPEMDACFKKNMSQLSENCRRAITAYKASGGK